MENQIEMHPLVEFISTIVMLVALCVGVVVFWVSMRISADNRKTDLYEMAPITHVDDGLPNDSAKPKD